MRKSVVFGLLSMVFVLVTAQNSMAYLRGVYSETEMTSVKIDYSVRTRVIVAGNGSELVNLFQQVAGAKARKYRELYPNDQIVFLGIKEQPEDSKGKKLEYDNIKSLNSFGFWVETVKIMGMDKDIDVENLTAALLKFKKIASIDIYSHASAAYGVVLDGKFNRLEVGDKTLMKIKDNMTEDSYVFLHGCNSAHVASYLSKVLEVPVAGSMTSTNSQLLMNDGRYYFEDEGTHPENLSFVKINSVGFKKKAGCYSGACVRLKPDRNPYNGYWGEFKEGLSFYKFFCAKNEDRRCKETMARSMLSWISTKAIDENSSLEDYKEVVKDFLCPTNKDGTAAKTCAEELEKAIQVGGNHKYNPFRGEQVFCDLVNCRVKVKCEYMPIIGIAKKKSCVQVQTTSSEYATTTVDEYLNYLEGFKYLK